MRKQNKASNRLVDKNEYSEYIMIALAKSIFDNKYKDTAITPNSQGDVFIYYLQNNVNRGMIYY